MIAPMETKPKVRLVLVGSSDPGRRELLDMLLVSSGFEAVQREDGQGVLAFLQGATPDAVVLDFDLPGADGREICSRVRSIKRLENTAVVLITRSVSELGGPDSLRAAIRSTSADLVLPEPIGDKNLIGRLENLFRERERSAVAAGSTGAAWDSGAMARHSTLMAEREAMSLAALEDEVRVLRAQLKASRRHAETEPCDPGLLVERDRSIAELQDRNTSLVRELERLRTEDAVLRTQLDACTALLVEHQNSMTDSESRLAEQREELERGRIREAGLLEEVSASHAGLAERDQRLVELQRRIDEQQSETERRDALIASLHRDLADLRESLERSDLEKTGLERRNGILLEELERRSAIEAPLREYLSNLLKIEPITDRLNGGATQSAGSFRG
jgi:CheY-like chemotaxis protein